MMKIDKKTIDALMNLSDDKLAQMVRVIAATSGNPLGEGKPDAAAIKGLRSLFKEVTDGDIERATKLIDVYKAGKK